MQATLLPFYEHRQAFFHKRPARSVWNAPELYAKNCSSLLALAAVLALGAADLICFGYGARRDFTDPRVEDPEVVRRFKTNESVGPAAPVCEGLER